MGLLGRYIDTLPAEARDRLIQAQDWCVASVAQADGGRCLVGHAEDWRALAVDDAEWRGWMDEPLPAGASQLDALCHPRLFAFRRARPADLAGYRTRLRRWGVDSEAAIGARFDRLCARRGVTAAVRLAKLRAGRDFAPALAPKPLPSTAAAARAAIR
jgi:hypothetical protein